MSLELIKAEVTSLSIDERKQLLDYILESLIAERTRTRSILEFEGVGEELRDDQVDPQDYVNQLRSEWDHRP